jgi:CubicO group peptidase (beta-lactamase class C family)
MNLAVVDGFEFVRMEGEPDEQFQAGSVSKPVAAFAVLRLVDEGLLELDEHVNERLLSWQLPDGDGVTLRGLAVTDPVRVVARPGDGFLYSGGGYVLLQLLLEDVSGRPFADLARELVFEPLGMTNSTFEQRTGAWHRYPEQAAAGLRTTAADLVRFVGVLQRDAASMWTPQGELPAEGEWTVMTQLGLVVPREYGFSLLLSDGWFGHPGGAQGFFSAIFGSTEGGNGIVAWVPSAPTPEFFAELVAAVDDRGWKGLTA